MLTLVQENILVSDDGRACLADPATASETSAFNAIRWSPPELLDTERFEFKKGGPAKKSDVYSMSMTIYEVRFPRSKSSQNIEVVPGSYEQAPIPRAQ